MPTEEEIMLDNFTIVSDAVKEAEKNDENEEGEENEP
jgi:hypothetical protein